MSTAVPPDVVAEPVTETILTAAADAPVTAAAAVVDPVVPDVAAPVVPETYELTLPENAALDATAIERTAAFARERGLTNEAASAALHLANTEVAAVLAARAQAESTLVESWKTETLADPALGKTAEERTAKVQKGVQILAKYGEAHPDQKATFDAFLNASGIGNHPAAVKFFAWLGESASEGSLVTSQIGGESQKSDAELFYGTSTK